MLISEIVCSQLKFKLLLKSPLISVFTLRESFLGNRKRAIYCREDLAMALLIVYLEKVGQKFTFSRSFNITTFFK